MEEEVGVIAEAGANPPNPLTQCLLWIGFNQEQANRIEEEVGTLEDVPNLEHTDINSLAKSFSNRTQGEGRMYFGLGRTKLMKALIDWAEDFIRVNEVPNIGGMKREEFVEALETSAQRAVIRESEQEGMDKRASAAAPGKLTSEKDWENWEVQFENQLSILIGSRGVSLLYVIREEEEPEPNAEYENFEQECIARCPLVGPKFESDSKTVHQLIVSYTTGEVSEQWIKPVKRYVSGRRDMEALRAHYRGEGNQTRRINEAEKIRDTIHYRSERAMPFGTFLSKAQRMFNLFQVHGEPYAEGAKLRFLLEKTQSQDLATTVAAIRAAVSINAEAYSFTSAANHLASQIPNVVGTGGAGRSVSAVGSSIYRNGKIITDKMAPRDWKKLSRSEQKAITDERIKQGLIPNKKEGRGNKNRKLQAKVAKLEKKLSATISSLKRKGGSDGSDSDSDGEVGNNNTKDNAGNSFGGRAEKAKAKKTKQG
jgi:hypothetical protein